MIIVNVFGYGRYIVFSLTLIIIYLKLNNASENLNYLYFIQNFFTLNSRKKNSTSEKTKRISRLPRQTQVRLPTVSKRRLIFRIKE